MHNVCQNGKNDKFSWWWVLVMFACIAALVWLERIPERGEAPPASLRSYWPTKIRVDTDMDSYWLPDEEQVCQTYPDKDGRVSVVACNASGSHRIHNISVTFWGDVDRNTTSDWKCRREKDIFKVEFVCRAIN
jgi:hypothetical protein